jgi:hypothetical protein
VSVPPGLSPIAPPPRVAAAAEAALPAEAQKVLAALDAVTKATIGKWNEAQALANQQFAALQQAFAARQVSFRLALFF